ncbi:type VI secretion system ATPase TssH [Roseateles sp. BYS180W]|uniref:Type VI secretion system ATPase TssH n=1 Tax=Roseateles rivi TaxID=3299028 RepID=A0ABW7FT17_9BURK
MRTVRRALFEKLSVKLFGSLESATALARERGDSQVDLVHWLLQIWRDEEMDFRRICQHFHIEDNALERDFSLALNRCVPRRMQAGLDFAPELELAVERAWLVASVQAGDDRVRSPWLLLALLQNPALRRSLLGISEAFAGLSPSGLLAEVQHLLQEWQPGMEPSHTPSAAGAPTPQAGASDSALASYCQDLTQAARAGQVDPVVGRDREIRMCMDVLLRRKQNNPLLVGEAGVGKTAVVEGLARAIVQGDVPPPLREVRLLSLDVGALLAGAAMRGEFEARLKAVLEEATRGSRPVILFVDEVHTLVGAGGQAGTGDAANLLKPALARGVLRMIGATTWSEYKRHIEKDPALTRRFQAQQIDEPDDATAVMMVRSLEGVFRQHHRVHVGDEAVQAAVALSRRYLPARQLPDKAISLLDTACARVAMAQHMPPATLQALQQSVADLALQLQSELRSQRLQGGAPDAQAAEATRARHAQAEAQLAEQEALWQTLRAELAQWTQLQAELAEMPDDPTPERQRLSEDLAALQQRIEASPLWGEHQSLSVDKAAVAAVVAEWTGIPAGQMLKDELQSLASLLPRLECRVMGQPAALRCIADRVKSARSQLTDPGKPMGVFMLVGPSGVGKTETALALAEAVYGGEHNLITINMSEYQEAHTVSGLKGSPPGYVGYGEGGVLTEAVRRKPYSVILLDEIEKAHPDVHELFYQVFDKGWMDDGEGRSIDFTNTLILLTSNVGAELIQEHCERSGEALPSSARLAELIDPALRQVFPAAFIGRVSVVPYLPLPQALLQRIAALALDKVAQRALQHQGLTLQVTDAALAAIVSQCGVHDTGARRIAQFIERHVLPALADCWIAAMTQPTASRAWTLDQAQSAQEREVALDPAQQLLLRPELDAAPPPVKSPAFDSPELSFNTDQEPL